jgi:signal recognition particle subunit SRP54
MGTEVLKSLNPSQVFIKIVHDELVSLMGGMGRRAIIQAPLPPTVILMAGLQGTGKTTTAAKLARRFKEEGRRVMLVAGDLARPAAAEQLASLGQGIEVEVMRAGEGEGAPALAGRAREEALKRGFDVLIVDTAGRLAIDEALMAELKELKAAARPHEVLLVVDSMQGQDALETSKRFHEAVGVDGLILTKLDGDARGGALLSALASTGKPVKFVGVGEKSEALEPFYPERMAGRILGMGDVVSLVEKVQDTVDAEKAQALAKKLAKNSFDFDDMLEQLEQLGKMGSMSQMLEMLPGMGGLKEKLPAEALDERRLRRGKAIIQSMTAKERRLPQIIHGERRKRIARGSGTKVEDVNQLLRQLEQMKKMMKTMKKGRRGQGLPGMGFPGMPGMPFGGMR